MTSQGTVKLNSLLWKTLHFEYCMPTRSNVTERHTVQGLQDYYSPFLAVKLTLTYHKELMRRDQLLPFKLCVRSSRFYVFGMTLRAWGSLGEI
jgi:hypothetical protein